MSTQAQQSYQRVNITLPQKTLQILDKVAPRGDRSRLIDQAIKQYILDSGKARLKDKIKEGAIARSERDLELAEDWFNLDQEVWESTTN